MSGLAILSRVILLPLLSKTITKRQVSRIRALNAIILSPEMNYNKSRKNYVCWAGQGCLKTKSLVTFCHAVSCLNMLPVSYISPSTHLEALSLYRLNTLKYTSDLTGYCISFKEMKLILLNLSFMILQIPIQFHNWYSAIWHFLGCDSLAMNCMRHLTSHTNVIEEDMFPTEYLTSSYRITLSR